MNLRKETGAEMRPAIVSEIVTGDASVSYCIGLLDLFTDTAAILN